MPCPHGRQRSNCKECGGGGICPHGRIRSQCKECGGSQICPHGRVRSVCKECGGSQICPHGRVRSVCKDCGGGGICPHGRRRCLCKECGGKSICAHGRRRNYCKECGGKGICAHGRMRSYCKECGGSQICPHGRRRSECKECRGSQICPHGRQRSKCKECGQGRKRKAGEALCRPAHRPPAKSGPMCQAAESLPKEAMNDRPEQLARRDEPMRQPGEQMEQELRIAEPRTRRQAMVDQRLPRAPRGAQDHLTARTNDEASSSTAWPVGCMVWAKLPRYQQAWPGRVADPVVAGVPVPSGRPRVLVMYYGENSYDWFKPEQLKTFEQGLDQGMRDAQASKHLKLALQLAMQAVGAATEPPAESGSVPEPKAEPKAEPSAEPSCVAVAHESGPAVGAPASPTMGGKRARPEIVEPGTFEDEIVDGDGDSFEVERIVARREQQQTGTEYLVKWQGYPEADNTWEPAAHLPAHLVAAFDESLSSTQPKNARLVKAPMCQPTHEPHQHGDDDAMVIDGFVVRCGAVAFEFDKSQSPAPTAKRRRAVRIERNQQVLSGLGLQPDQRRAKGTPGGSSRPRPNRAKADDDVCSQPSSEDDDAGADVEEEEDTGGARTSRWRPFGEAVEYVRSLGLSGERAWVAWRKSGARPADIPSNPHTVYAGQGWQGMGHWLGTGNVRGKDFRPFGEALEFVQSLGLPGRKGWREWCKSGARPADIPADPGKVYAGQGWQGWGHWLGTGNLRGGRRSAGRAPTNKPLPEERSDSDDSDEDDEPSDNAELDCDDSSEDETEDGDADSFEVERIVARRERRQAGTEYLVKWQGYPEADNTWEPAAHLPVHLVAAFDESQSPAQPAASAEEEETDEGETEQPRAGRWRPFGEALEFARSLGLPGYKAWCEWGKSGARPDDIPGRPDLVYAGQGWESWGHWLGTGNVAKHNKEFRPFAEAVEFVQSLELSCERAWREWSKSDARPADIPSHPNMVYAGQGWQGWGHWLGTGNLSGGRRSAGRAPTNKPLPEERSDSDDSDEDDEPSDDAELDCDDSSEDETEDGDADSFEVERKPEAQSKSQNMAVEPAKPEAKEPNGSRQMEDWLARHRLEYLADLFGQNRIDLEALQLMGKQEFAEIGMKIGDRLKVEKARAVDQRAQAFCRRQQLSAGNGVPTGSHKG